MKTIRELIDKSWDLVENNQIDGDLLPCLDDCEQEFMDAESKLNKLLICDVNNSEAVVCNAMALGKVPYCSRYKKTFPNCDECKFKQTDC